MVSPAREAALDVVPASMSGWLGVLGMALGFGLIARLRLEGFERTCLLLTAVALPMIAHDLLRLRVHRRPTAGLSNSPGASPAYARVGVKLLGLYATLAALGLLYWAFPEYHGTFYEPFWSALKLSAPWFVPVSVLYVAWIDARMQQPEDGYWHVGCAVLLRWDMLDRRQLGQHIRTWLIKGFFLPLMFVYCDNNVDVIADGGLHLGAFGQLLSGSKPEATFLDLHEALMLLMYTVDVALAAVGYLLTLRAFDSHVRSAEPTLLGWAVALACYQPFWSLLAEQYLGYGGERDWLDFVGPGVFLRGIWGGAMLILVGIYVWATVAFGLRFSNLTHRGIVIHGPYRYTKHPAYLAKSAFWWLGSFPLLAHADLREGLRHSALLALLNLIYWLRARTEERHLSRDPAYLAYSRDIKERGLFARLRRSARSR